MADHLSPCDPARLRLSLEDRLSDAEQVALAGHLEVCEACRIELERMAAVSQLWGDARLLRGEPEPGGALTVGFVPALLPEEEDAADPGAPGPGPWLEFLDPPLADRPDALGRLGGYEILEVLGQGGMGVVLKARDSALDRTVAIKVLNPALAHAATARRRFAREARAAAAVSHEHVVAIYNVDEFRGFPFLVMQYIPGRSLQERLDESGPLEVKEILRIGVQAARALAAAHAQGVVHRDIKPANILLENCVERVKLTDFGLSRAIDDASLTQSGVIAGTPQYMAPEQARGEPVNARADLFSLGAVLYATAAGRPPFRADSAMAVLKRVCDDRQRSIRELNPDVPEWLEIVIDRLLAKSPAERIQSADELADLLERGLAHLQQPTAVPRPVVQAIPAPQAAAPATSAAPMLDLELPVAKPTSARKRPRPAWAASLLLLGLVGLGATEASGLTQISEIVATVLRIKTPEGTLVVKVDDPGVKVDVDNEVVIIGGAGPQEVRLKTGLHRVQASRNGQPVRDEIVSIMKGKKEIVTIGFEPAPIPASPVTLNQPSMEAPFSHAQQCMVCHNPPVALDRPLPPNHPYDARELLHQPYRNLGNGALGGALNLIRTRGLVWSLAFSPDGRHLAIGQQAFEGRPSPVRIWDLARKQEAIWFVHSSGNRSVAFSPDGKTHASGTFDGDLVLNRITGDGGRPLHWVAAGSAINIVAFTPDSKIVVTGQWDGTVKLWEVESGRGVRSFNYPSRVFALAVSPDGTTLAVAGEAGVISLHDVSTGRQIGSFTGHQSGVESLAFSPDGAILASAGWDHTVRLWDRESKKGIAVLRGLERHVLCVRFSPDGKLVAASEGQSGVPHTQQMPCQIRIWDTYSHMEVRNFPAHFNSIFALAFSPDGKTLASGSMDQTVSLWDVATGKLRENFTPGETGTRTGMGGAGGIGSTRALVGPGASSGATAASSASSASSTSSPRPDVVLPHGDKIEARSAAYSPDGKVLITGGSGGALIRWEVARLPGGGRPLAQFSRAEAIAFSPDGELFATANGNHTVGLFGAEGDQIATIEGHKDIVRTVAFSPDSRLVASGSWDRTVRVWDVATRRLVGAIGAQQEPVNAVAFSPDGKLLATGTGDWQTERPGEVRLWDARTLKQIPTVMVTPRDVKSLAFSPDGRKLAIACAAAEEGVAVVGLNVREQDVIIEPLARLNCPTGATAVAFSPDGSLLVAGQWNGKLSIWDASSTTALTVAPVPVHASMIFDLAFSPDGKQIVTASKDGTVKLWDLNELIHRNVKPNQTRR
jgi:serine/threonine-protein kinase